MRFLASRNCLLRFNILVFAVFASFSLHAQSGGPSKTPVAVTTGVGSGVGFGGPSAADAASWWAYEEVYRPAVPKTIRRGWIRNPIDAFLLEGLEREGLSPARPTDRVSLLRRATYDLTGLPPTEVELRDFLSDDRPGAYERQVERLLLSPQYGVKWGRHWLDLVRFAETDSYERDRPKPHAWRYRDWVINSLNADKPYDRFLLEQLAGDELPDASLATKIATGYYHLGIRDDEPTELLQAQYDDLDGILDTTCRVMLGISMGCARCHDHKRDPISQREYYAMLACFENILPYKERAGNSITRGNFTATVDAQTGALVLPEKSPAKKPGAKKPGGRPTIEILVVKEQGAQPAPSFIRVRGNALVKGDEVIPAVPAVIGSLALNISKVSKTAKTSMRRRALAEWITNPRNPLTAKVMVNRIWQHHFGRGLVRSTNDFGRLGTLPTHPRLLAWLGSEFVRQGWSQKAMHRLIMTSTAYRMSSKTQQVAVRRDPRNDRFWRFDMRRLSAEEIRDSILAVSGTLQLELGGPGVYPIMPPDVLATASRPDAAWGKSSAQDAARRSVYVHVKRSLLLPILQAYDLADTDASCPQRFNTTQPTQALTMLNGDFIHAQAKLFRQRLEGEAETLPRQIELGLRLVTQRAPRPRAVAEGLALISDLQSRDGLDFGRAFDAWCLCALNLNEFVYLD